MNVQRLIFVAVLHAVVTVIALSQIATAQEMYVPPNVASYGEQEHYKYLAVIETECETFEELDALKLELQKGGALIAVITSPKRLLAWVPPNAQINVANARVNTPRGGVGVKHYDYDAQEINNRVNFSKVEEGYYNEADESIVDFLEFVRRPKTSEELAAIEAAKPSLDELLAHQASYVDNVVVDAGQTAKEKLEDKLFGGPDPVVDYASHAHGTVVHTSFFCESIPGTSTQNWNWPTSVYTDYKNYYIAGLTYWSSLASRYGRVLNAQWRLFGRSSAYAQVTGEPTLVGDDVYIREIVRRITTASPGNTHLGIALRYAHKYNQLIEAAYGREFAFCAFISYKPSNPKKLHPTAFSLIWGGTDIEGVYFRMDTRYYGNTPFDRPYRNVCAHEIGHLFGAPDEYHDTWESCNYSYRGLKNLNCQKVRAPMAVAKPGWFIDGWEGIMKGNYTGGNSMATPVHVGLVSAANRTLPIPGFKTEPVYVKMDIKTCDGGTKTQYVARTYPLDFGFCMSASTLAKSGSYYFDHWEVKRKTGSPSIYHDEGPELSRYRLYSTRSNPISEVIAHFTNNPPDFNVTNNTLSAWLAPGSSTGTPKPAVALRWRVKYDMSLVQTKIEYERSAGNWVELRTSNMSLGGPAHQNINRWTGVWIFSVPGTGSTNVDIQSNREYKFRIVGYFNTIRGNESVVASVTTRPAAPTDTIFCYDPNENNSLSSPKVLPSSGNGASPYKIQAASHIFGREGEFSWHRPKNDYYRLTAINLSPIGFGQRLVLALRTKPGSSFRPLFRAKRVGSSTYINSTWQDGARVLSLGSDGEYIISVEPEIHGVSGMYDIVDRLYGTFGFGEYEINVERLQNHPEIMATCPTCVRLVVPRPIRGWLLLDPPPPPELMLPRWKGFDKMKGTSLMMTHIPPPGYENDGFEGDPFGGSGNPLQIAINPNTPDGEHRIDPKLKPIDPTMVELLLIRPDGPGGPLTRRTKHVIGATTSAQATAPAGYNFVGWGYDTSSSTNPLPVTMWKNKTLIAYFRPIPCVPTQMTQWQHSINVMTASQSDVDMLYGMDASSTDGLDPSETDLPPTPPLGNHDGRFVNITGSQGSTTDMRPIRQTHTYSLRIQTASSSVPVLLTWGAPPPTPNADFEMIIPGAPGPINMRTVNNYELLDPGIVYQIRIIVTAKECPPPSKPRDVTVIPGVIDPSNFPCVDMELIVKESQGGKNLPFYNPFNLRMFETNEMGEDIPLKYKTLYQMDSTIWVRFCSDDESGDKPDRRIRIINDDDDPEKPKDTLDVLIPIPQPPSGKDITKTTWDIPRGWDLVSVPLDVNAELATTMFTPWPTTQVYWFEPWALGYQNEDTMRFGRGYWVNSIGLSVGIFGAAETSLIHDGLNGLGEPIGHGWNLIGAPSKSLSVAMIDQNPAGSLMSIFGWDIATGYVVPTMVETGRGYWVRVQKGATLKMEGTSIQGGAYFETAYSRTQKEITPAGWLEISTPLGDKRYMSIATNPLTNEQVENLLIPPTPAAAIFDIRTEDQTLFIEPGVNKLLIQGNSEATIKLLHPTGAMSCIVMTDKGEILADLNDGEHHSFTWKPEMGSTLLLKYAVKAQLPNGFDLGTAYPNPASFSDDVTIPYHIDIDRDVSFVIYDMLGREVRMLSSGLMPAGARFIQWNGVDNAGAKVMPGIYLCRMTSNGQSETTTIVIAQ